MTLSNGRHDVKTRFLLVIKVTFILVVNITFVQNVYQWHIYYDMLAVCVRVVCGTMLTSWYYNISRMRRLWFHRDSHITHILRLRWWAQSDTTPLSFVEILILRRKRFDILWSLWLPFTTIIYDGTACYSQTSISDVTRLGHVWYLSCLRAWLACIHTVTPANICMQIM